MSRMYLYLYMYGCSRHHKGQNDLSCSPSLARPDFGPVFQAMIIPLSLFDECLIDCYLLYPLGTYEVPKVL